MNSLHRHIILLILATTVPRLLHAQLFSEYNFRFKTYTTNDGLAHNSTKRCISDSRGFLWIITENGLSRFDGYQFKNYQHSNHDSSSLPVNDLSDIAIDEQDKIYLAYKSGLCVLDAGSGKFTRIQKEEKAIEAEKIHYDKQSKQLFIATRNGLLKYNPLSQKIFTTALTGKTPNVITALCGDNDHYLWMLIERHGYYRYSISKDSVYYYDSYDWPISLHQDTEGVYYLSTWGSGFQVFNGLQQEHQKEVYNLKLSDVPGNNYIYSSAAEVPQLTGTDILWVPGEVSGIGLFSKSKKRFVKHLSYQPWLKNGLASGFNWSLYVSPDGSLWICNWHGLMKVNGQNQYFQNSTLPELHSAVYNAVSGVTDDPNNNDIAWMAVCGNGIAQYNKTTGTITKRFYFDNEDVFKHYLERWPVFFHKDSTNTIWSSTYGGLIKISNSKVSFTELTDSTKYCYPGSNFKDSRGHIWVAGWLLFEFNPYTEKNTTWHIPELNAVYSRAVCEGSNGQIFIGCSKGIFTLNPYTGKAGRLFFAQQLADSVQWNNVYSLLQIGQVLYIGTEKGVAAFNITSGQLKTIGSDKNLNKTGSNAFYKDRLGNLWVYASSGLYRYTPSNEELLQFTTADGVYTHSNDPSYFFEYNGNVYLGNRMAYTRFNPEYINSNQNTPVPYITSITVNNQIHELVPGSKTLRLQPQENNINFDFTAIEYNFPEKITFSYKLEGFDTSWSEPAFARKKSYTNLPPGKYSFQVRAFNNQHHEGKTIAVYSFEITPPFWQTTWFRALAFLLMVAVLFALYKFRIRQVRQKEAEKNKLQQVQLEQYKQQLELEQIINFFTSSLSDKNTKEEVIWDVAKNLIHKLGFANCMIYLWNDDKTILLQKAGYGPNGSLETVIKEPFNAVLWQGIVGHVAATQKPIMLGDTSKDPRYRADVLSRYSELCVPALYNGELISVIDSEDFAKDYYTPQHLQILTTIATLMAAKLVSIDAAEDIRHKKEELIKMNEQLAQLELASLRSQMNPHFIFNSLNSIHKYIWENKKEDASEYLTKFSRLVRMILENSKEKTVSLADEIKLLHLYIELEHRRCNGRFNYRVTVDINLDPDNLAIPSMIIQPYVENAIWHGLVQKEGTGELSVSLNARNNMLECCVEDDGIGREKAMEIKLSKQDKNKSLGLSITNKRLELLGKESGINATVTVIDKKDETGNACGTKVIIELPLTSIY